jgi:hypothetical protein
MYSFLSEQGVLDYILTIPKVYTRRAYHNRNILSHKLKKFMKKREELQNEVPPNNNTQDDTVYYDPVTDTNYIIKNGVAVEIPNP